MEELELYRGADRRRCRELALVLQSTGIPSRQIRDGGAVVLLVAEEHAQAALEELASYQRENEHVKARPAPEWLPRAGRFEALGYALLLAGINAADKSGLFGIDWQAEGRTEGGRGVLGNLDRAFTSLTLHADTRHLLSNVLYGCLFSLLLSQAVGSGVAWMAILFSGFFGNLVSVAFSPSQHASIGASTLVFGALGVLSAYQWRVHKRANLGFRQWAPLVAGTVLLGFFGFGNEGRINYMAHLTGFLSGVALGAGLGSTRPLQFSRTLQRGLLGGTLAIVLVAWVFAILT
jgi:membrane associated rhomboid family serine protease